MLARCFLLLAVVVGSLCAFGHSAVANVWTVPNTEGITAIVVDPNPNSPGLIGVRGNQLVHFSFARGLSVLAGTEEQGFADGKAEIAQFWQPCAIAIDSNGDILVADTGNNRLRSFNRARRTVSTIAGPGYPGFAAGYRDGLATFDARFFFPRAIALDKGGNVLIADSNNHVLRKFELGSRMVSTIAGDRERAGFVSGYPTNGLIDGPANQATFNNPAGLVVDKFGNAVVSDSRGDRIRLYKKDSNEVLTIAGSATPGSNRGFRDGLANEAKFIAPEGLCLGLDDTIVIADTGGHRVRVLDPKTNQVVTLAGIGLPGANDGPPLQASFNFPTHVAALPSGGVFVAQHSDAQLLQPLRFIAPKDDYESALVKMVTSPSSELPNLNAIPQTALNNLRLHMALRSVVRK